MKKPRHILVVEDEPMQMLALSRVLQQHYVVSQASGFQEALEMLAQMPAVAAVVSDWNLDDPAGDGLALLELVRERYPQAVRLLVSSRIDSTNRLPLLTSGVVHEALAKPWGARALISTLGRQLRRTPPQLRASPDPKRGVWTLNETAG